MHKHSTDTFSNSNQFVRHYICIYTCQSLEDPSENGLKKQEQYEVAVAETEIIYVTNSRSNSGSAVSRRHNVPLNNPERRDGSYSILKRSHDLECTF